MKKKANLPVIAVAVVAVCLVAIAGVLVMKASNSGPAVSSDSISDSVGGNSNYYGYDETTTSPSTTLQSILDITTQVATDTYVPSTQKPTEKQTEETTKKETTTKAPETTLPPKGELNEEEMEHSSGASVPVTPSGKLPADMSLAGLYNSGYDVIGLKPYIFNDDKDPDCMQRKFGYNSLYDMGANLIDFSIETTKIDFTYSGKKYRFQFWKGQYISGEIGTVGGEIGIYTRDPGKVYPGSHYDCADEEDWLMIEMTCLWDENGDGNYLPQFTRNYDIFWWPTGFVDGQLANRYDSNSLRLLARITFKDTEQAQLFAQAMSNKGFTEVSTFVPTEIDTFKIHGKDVIFLWQNIR